jgi:formylglycine-generating enzyme required for sulfatase activity
VPYILPDSSNTWWRKQEFRHYPIVLISREQAITYCMWRSKMVSRKLGYEVNFRLPTPEEWSIIASHLIKNNARLIDSAFKKNRKKLSGKNQKYFLFESSTGQEYPKESIKSIVHYFDNVSELTSTPNIALGGNNEQMIIPDTTRSHEIKHLEPGRFIGFRCIVEIDESSH